MVKSSVKKPKKTTTTKKVVKEPLVEKQNVKIGIALGVILILLMLMANT
tara:strand:+ start:435 stop:581 length:147 start_codon:yes stop_codon:yes gene_type:complete